MKGKPLPGPGGVLGLKNIWNLHQGGFLETFRTYWERYGDIFEVRLGPKRIIVVIHPEHVRHITITNASNYEKLKSYDVVRKYITSDGIVTSIGDLWKRQRRLMAPFYTPKGIQSFADVMIDDGQSMIARWEHLAQTAPRVEMFDEMARVTASIVLRSIFSTGSEEDILRIKDSVETMVSFTNRVQMNPLRWPDWVPIATNRAYWEAHETGRGFVQSILDARLAMDPEDYPDDLLSKLITAVDPETGEQMPRELLLDEAINNFFAGYETSARSMSYAWYALARHHEVRERLHEELDHVLGDAVPTLETLKQLPYTLQVIKEVLRLHPAIPVYAKDVVDDDVLDGYHIPRGSMIMLMQYYTHRHPDFWDDPERFDPARHTPEATRERHTQAFHPFGSGARICLGNHFSLLETHILLASLARHFNPRLLEGYEAQFSMQGILDIDNGLPMVLERRRRR